VNRNIHFNRLAVFVFGLRVAEPTGAHVLAAKPNGVLSSASRVKQERQGEAGLTSDWVPGLEFRQFLQRP
jgi:hypothetical protein